MQCLGELDPPAVHVRVRCRELAFRPEELAGDAEVAPIMSTLKYWRPEYLTLIQEAQRANLINPEPALRQ